MKCSFVLQIAGIYLATNCLHDMLKFILLRAAALERLCFETKPTLTYVKRVKTIHGSMPFYIHFRYNLFWVIVMMCVGIMSERAFSSKKNPTIYYSQILASLLLWCDVYMSLCEHSFPFLWTTKSVSNLFCALGGIFSLFFVCAAWAHMHEPIQITHLFTASIHISRQDGWIYSSS